MELFHSFIDQFHELIILEKLPPSAGFLLPSGGAVSSAFIWETAALGGGKRKRIKFGAVESAALSVEKRNWGACGAPNGF